jgi:hypothetical protein
LSAALPACQQPCLHTPRGCCHACSPASHQPWSFEGDKCWDSFDGYSDAADKILEARGINVSSYTNK